MTIGMPAVVDTMHADVLANIQSNRETWGREWEDDGESWSRDFGGTKRLWNEFLFPRLREGFPVDNLLEIAVGYGRITKYLEDYGNHLYGLDLNWNCVKATREKVPSAIIEMNDGLTIPFDVEFGLVFSWDSLVHCHPDVVKNYITQSAERLAEDGAIVFHHSTWKTSGAPNNPHWRDMRCSAEDIRQHAESLGLVVNQERFKWGYEYETDCLTTMRWT